MSAGEQDAAILDAARAVLERDGLTAATAGELHRLALIAESVEHRVTAVESWDVALRSAAVVRADEDSATVELDAEISASAMSVSGARVVWKSKIEGPVELVRAHGEWKVTDLVVEGQSVRDEFVELERMDEVDGLRARVLAARVRPPGVRYYLELENLTAKPILLRHAAVAIRRRTFGWRWARGLIGTAQLEPGTSRVEASGTIAKLRPGDDVRLLFEAGPNRVDLRPPSVSRRFTTPLSVRSPILSWLVTVTAIATAVGLLARILLPPLSGVFEAGVVLIIVSTSLLWQLSRQAWRRFTRAFVPWFAAGLGALAVGVGLALSDIGISSLGRLRACFVYLFFNWWGLGLLLLCGALTLVLDHRPKALRRLSRATLVWACAVVAAAGIGAVLVERHGGFLLLWPAGWEERNVRAYIRDAFGGDADISSLHKVASREVDDCAFDAWDARTEYGRFWVVTNDFELLSRGEARTADRALDMHLARQRRSQVVVAKALGDDVPAHPSACPRLD